MGINMGWSWGENKIKDMGQVVGRKNMGGGGGGWLVEKETLSGWLGDKKKNMEWIVGRKTYGLGCGRDRRIWCGLLQAEERYGWEAGRERRIITRLVLWRKRKIRGRRYKQSRHGVGGMEVWREKKAIEA